MHQSEVPFIDNNDCLMLKYKLAVPAAERESYHIRNFRCVDKVALSDGIRHLSVAHVRKLTNSVNLNAALKEFINSANAILDSDDPSIAIFPRSFNTPWL